MKAKTKTPASLSDTEIVDKISHELSMLAIRMAATNGYSLHQAVALSDFSESVNKLIARRLWPTP